VAADEKGILTNVKTIVPKHPFEVLQEEGFVGEQITIDLPPRKQHRRILEKQR
jgi:hypothetical protein